MKFPPEIMGSPTWKVGLTLLFVILIGGHAYNWLGARRAFITAQVAEERARELVERNETLKRDAAEVTLALHAERLRSEAESKLQWDKYQNLVRSVESQSPEQLIASLAGLIDRRGAPAPVISEDRTRVTISVDEYRNITSEIAELKAAVARIPALEAQIAELNANVSFQRDELRRLTEIITEKDRAIDGFKAAAKTSGFKRRAIQVGAIAVGIAIGRAL